MSSYIVKGVVNALSSNPEIFSQNTIDLSKNLTDLFTMKLSDGHIIENIMESKTFDVSGAQLRGKLRSTGPLNSKIHVIANKIPFVDSMSVVGNGYIMNGDTRFQTSFVLNPDGNLILHVPHNWPHDAASAVEIMFNVSWITAK